MIFFASLSKLFKFHWTAVVGALLCGVLFVLPQFVLRWDLGQEYKGMVLGGIDGEFYYMRIQEVYDGNFTQASPGLFEYKDLPYTNSPLGELTAAGLGKLTGVQAPGVIVVGDFVFPILLFLVFYFLFWRLTGEKLLSFAAAAGILLASNFLLVPRNVLDLFLSSQGIVVNLYNRPIHPQVSSLYFFVWLLVFWRLFFRNTPRPGTAPGSPALSSAQSPSQEGNQKSPLPWRGAEGGVGWWRLLFPGILFGLLFYVYPYSWMMAVVLQVMMMSYVFWKEVRLTKNNSDRRSFSLVGIDWQQTKDLLISFAIGLIVAIPYFLNFIKLISHPWYDTLKKFQGFYSTHEPVFSLLLVVDVVIIIVLMSLRHFGKPASIDASQGGQSSDVQSFNATTPNAHLKIASSHPTSRNDNNQRILMFASVFVLSSFILLNQQVVTGVRFFPGHWHWYYVVPFSVFLVLFAVWSILEKWPKTRKVLFVTTIAIFLVNGIVSQKNYYRDASPSSIESQRLAPVYDWLNRNTPRHSVVLADDRVSQWISFYTHNDHYLSTFFDTLSLIPESRVRHDFFVKKYLEGEREENVDEFINQRTPELNYVLFGYWRKYQFGCKACFPEEEIEELKQEYREFLKNDFEDELKRYHVDYVVVDEKRGEWSVEDLDFLNEAARVGEFVIYKID